LLWGDGGRLRIGEKRVAYDLGRHLRTVFGTEEEVPKTEDEEKLAGDNERKFQRHFRLFVLLFHEKTAFSVQNRVYGKGAARKGRAKAIVFWPDRSVFRRRKR
jgi:hypothetical protein